ncbi:hypothetical protein SBF1_5130008 [Candidatus Desulfosporosinus infrequens]|uniref:Uncharacterized protein n=1 Tax=Candidatus Desulfosporosinus infrequens TaxID=2043169 RepID=A0A2U3LHV5_9FIRM|nr:hypothetical protein SBF1_5130008 [Candidatus Desulfosporosinus infrequens]
MAGSNRFSLAHASRKKEPSKSLIPPKDTLGKKTSRIIPV